MELISIIVPCYNQAQFLDECLQSVLEQTYTDWECIIINDGSPDNTEEIAKNWLEKDGRFKYYYKVNGGVSSARNFGITRCNGNWILPLDADDKIGNQYLELAEKEFNNDYSIIYSLAEFFGDKECSWDLKKFDFITMLKGNQIFCSAFFKKEYWKLVGEYDLNMIYGREDWEFWLSILKINNRVLRLDYVGFYYRVKEFSRNNDVSNNLEQINLMEKYVFKKHLELYESNFFSFQTYLRNEQKIDILINEIEWFRKNINKNKLTKILFKIIVFINKFFKNK